MQCDDVDLFVDPPPGRRGSPTLGPLYSGPDNLVRSSSSWSSLRHFVIHRGDGVRPGTPLGFDPARARLVISAGVLSPNTLTSPHVLCLARRPCGLGLDSNSPAASTTFFVRCRRGDDRVAQLTDRRDGTHELVARL